MQTHLRPVLDEVWSQHRSALAEAIRESLRELANVLRLDDYHRHGHEEENLEKVLGPYGTSGLDLSSLSNVLSRRSGSRIMSGERRDRIIALQNALEQELKVYAKTMDEPPLLDFSETEEKIHTQAEAYLNTIAEAYRLLRIAQLEIRSKYHAPTHDPLFTNFNWRQLSPGELSKCPPFVVVARLEENSGPQLRKMMALLESRKPIKIAVSRSSIKKTYSPTADPSLPASLSIETVPMAMRGIYFLQTCPAVEGYRERLSEAFSSSRPGLISYLGHQENEKEPDYVARIKHAVRSRAFPIVLYNPDTADEFVSCFDLSGNPCPEETWASDKLNKDEETGEHGYTFADFAATQPEFGMEFSIPGPDLQADSLVPLVDYIQWSRRQRIGKHPVVTSLDAKGESHTRIASQAIVTQTCDQIHLWKSLQEVAGINNPHVQTTRVALNAEFGVQQKALLESLQEEMEQQQNINEREMIAGTVRQIVSHLTGVDPSKINLD